MVHAVMAHSERSAQLVKTSLAIAWLVGVGATALIYSIKLLYEKTYLQETNAQFLSSQYTYTVGHVELNFLKWILIL